MKISEYFKIIKCNNNNVIVFVKYGNFYRCFNSDALIMFYLFDYKITAKNSVGFPIKTLSKILIKLKNKNISCIVINGVDDFLSYMCLNNNYNNYLNKAIDYNLYCNYVNYLIELIKKILKADINKYDLIKDFLKKVSI